MRLSLRIAWSAFSWMRGNCLKYHEACLSLLWILIIPSPYIFAFPGSNQRGMQGCWRSYYAARRLGGAPTWQGDVCGRELHQVQEPRSQTNEEVASRHIAGVRRDGDGPAVGRSGGRAVLAEASQRSG